MLTGGASGIGESIVRLFMRHGAKVCIADIQDNMGRLLCGILGAETCFYHCDVTVENDVCSAVDFAVEKLGVRIRSTHALRLPFRNLF